MKDKFSLYQADGFWGIIEDFSDEKQTSIKSYFGSDLIIKRLNEQADQIDQLKQQLSEKDKEIEEKMMSFEKGCQEYYKSDKFKRDFAIQELEKVKELLLIESKNNPIIYDVNDDTVGGALDRDKTFEVIDQQIKELKGE